LDRIKDSQVISLIERIADHYQTNISNRFLRPLILQLQIDKSTWDQIELLTEKMELFRYQGFHLDELYHQIAACARFVDTARHGLIPTIRNKLNSIPGSSSDRTLREMAANNFVSNLQLFADLLKELYTNLIELDKQTSKNSKPVYDTIPDLSGVDRMLSAR
jgi:hypothetical protein